MAADHLTLNVGGRLFYTTRGTLEFSKAGFFEALVKRWAPSPRKSVDSNFTDDQDSIATDRPAKRPRRQPSVSEMSPCVLVDSSKTSEEPTVTMCSSDNGASEDSLSSVPVFIDRDPDAFEDVLYFLRCQRIKPATSIDACRLQLLEIEGEFFGYEALVRACQAQLSKLAQLQRPTPPAIAYSDTALLGNRANVNKPRREIKIPDGQLLYIEFASIWGVDTLSDTQRVNLGFYRRSSERMPEGRRQLRAITIICSGRRNMDNPFAQRIGICISPKGKNDKVGLICAPVVPGILWQVHYWLGPASQIPQLSGGGKIRAAPERPDPISLLLNDESNEVQPEAAAVTFQETGGDIDDLSVQRTETENAQIHDA